MTGDFTDPDACAMKVATLIHQRHVEGDDAVIAEICDLGHDEARILLALAVGTLADIAEAAPLTNLPAVLANLQNASQS